MQEGGAARASPMLVEHDMRVTATSDRVIDIGPGAGSEGGRVLAAGTPAALAQAGRGRTTQYLKQVLG